MCTNYCCNTPFNSDGVVEQCEVRGASRRDPDLPRPAATRRRAAVARWSGHRWSHELHAGWEVRAPPRPRAPRRPCAPRIARAASSIALAACAPPSPARPHAARPHHQGSGAAPPGAGVRGRLPVCCCCCSAAPPACCFCCSAAPPGLMGRATGVQGLGAARSHAADARPRRRSAGVRGRSPACCYCPHATGKRVIW